MFFIGVGSGLVVTAAQFTKFKYKQYIYKQL